MPPEPRRRSIVHLPLITVPTRARASSHSVDIVVGPNLAWRAAAPRRSAHMPGTQRRTHTDRSAREDARAAPQLFVARSAAEPGRPPCRFALDGIELVVLGRGDADGASRSRSGSLARLELRFADGWTSTEHARIVKAAGRWVLEDRGS